MEKDVAAPQTISDGAITGCLAGIKELSKLSLFIENPHIMCRGIEGRWGAEHGE